MAVSHRNAITTRPPLLMVLTRKYELFLIKLFRKDMSAVWCVVDRVPRSGSELEERFALGVEKRRLGGRVTVHRHPFVPVAGIPGYRVDRALFTCQIKFKDSDFNCFIF